MIATPPLGGAAKRIRAHTTGPATFVLGAVVAGLFFGGSLGAVGKLPGVAIVGALSVVVVIVLVLLEHTRFAIRAPNTRWQVPRHWVGAGRFRFSLVFGMLLGLGVATIVKSWTIYVLLLGAVAQGGILAGASIVGAFGLARAMPMMLVAADSTAHILPSGEDTRTMAKLRCIAGPPGLLRWLEVGVITCAGGSTLSGLFGI